MNRFLTRSALVIVALLQLSATLYAGPLDDYYLQQFGEAKSIQLQKAILSAAPAIQEAAKCGMPLKHALKRDWNLLEQTTRKVLAKQLALPTLSGTEQTVLSSGGHFLVHYTTTGVDAPHINDYTVNSTLVRGINYFTGLTSAADWAATVAATFENVYAQYSSLGYQLAPATSGTYDIYLNDQASQGYYGVTNSGPSASSATYPNGVTSWMELDSSFTNGIYKTGTFTPLQSLQITATHEYHHAIQYGYNIYFDVWYAEATSTWMEDELYDGVNQLYNYIPAWFTNSTTPLDLWDADPVSSGAGYGRWIFNRYLSEKHTPAMIRNVWEKVGTLTSPGNNADIPMTPVLDSVLSSTTYGTSLTADFFGFAKRVYTRDWTTHTNETNRIHVYSPVATYSVYPVNGTSSPSPSITLPHYSFAYYKFTPTGVSTLTISINKSTGIQTALFKNGSEITASAGSTATTDSYVAGGLGATDEVVLLIANTSSLDGHNANFSTDGKLVAITEPTPPPSTSANGNGCFIATAAYGSYLHPQVQLLRNFRDDYLLTNAPGRAFVAFYYRFSPPLADVIGRHPALRGMTRLLLTPLAVAVAYPIISIVSLFLLAGTLLTSRLRRIKAARSNAQSHIIRTISRM